MYINYKFKTHCRKSRYFVHKIERTDVNFPSVGFPTIIAKL